MNKRTTGALPLEASMGSMKELYEALRMTSRDVCVLRGTIRDPEDFRCRYNVVVTLTEVKRNDDGFSFSGKLHRGSGTLSNRLARAVFAKRNVSEITGVVRQSKNAVRGLIAMSF